jgi:FixJ family two-component response regulator
MAANQLIKNEAKKHGADDFIEKPFDINKLLELINSYLKNELY